MALWDLLQYLPEEPSDSFAIGVFLFVILFLKLFQVVILFRLRKISQKTKNDFDDILVDVIECIGGPLYLVLALYVSLKFITVPAYIDNGLYYTIFIIATYYGVRSIQIFIDYGSKKIIKQQQKEDKKADVSAI